MKQKLTIELSEIITFEISVERNDWLKFLETKYKIFLVNEPKHTPLFNIQIKFVKNGKTDNITVKRSKSEFEASFNDNKRQFKKLDFFIKRLLGKRLIETKKGIIIHSSALEINKKGFIFSAPSGTGKSTLVKNSPSFTPINDDFSIIITNRPRINIVGSPFHEKVKIKRNNMSLPLDSIYFIYQSKLDSIKRLPKDISNKKLLKNLLALQSDSKEPDMLRSAFDQCYYINQHVPAYNLGIKLGSTFIEKIYEGKKISSSKKRRF